MTKSKSTTGRGGRRAGAGRKPSKPTPPAREVIVVVPAVATVDDVIALAKSHTSLAVQVLAEIAANGGKEAARVAAANSLLDRAHGKTGAAGGVEGKKAERQSNAEKVATESKYAPRARPHLAVDNG